MQCAFWQHAPHKAGMWACMCVCAVRCFGLPLNTHSVTDHTRGRHTLDAVANHLMVGLTCWQMLADVMSGWQSTAATTQHNRTRTVFPVLPMLTTVFGPNTTALSPVHRYQVPATVLGYKEEGNSLQVGRQISRSIGTDIGCGLHTSNCSDQPGYSCQLHTHAAKTDVKDRHCSSNGQPPC